MHRDSLPDGSVGLAAHISPGMQQTGMPVPGDRTDRPRVPGRGGPPFDVVATSGQISDGCLGNPLF